MNGAPDPSTSYRVCRLTATCVVERDDGTFVTGSVIRSMPPGKVSDAPPRTDLNGVPMLAWPNDPTYQ